MPHRFPRWVFYVSLLSFFTAVLFPLHLEGQQYNFMRYSVRDGLPQSQVNCVFQDQDGFMWIGTDAGASRFDGREFESFTVENGLPGNEVTAIAETNDGVLLATDSGIVVYAAGKFKQYPLPQNGFTQINAFIKGPTEDMLLATDYGLYRFSGGKYIHIITSTPLDKLPIKTGYLDVHGNLWVGTQRNGLFKLQFDNGLYTSVSFPEQEKLANTRVRGISEADGGDIWIATSGQGLFSFDGNVVSKLLLPEKAATDYFTCIHKDMFGDIWLGTWGNGVVFYSHSVFRVYNRQNGLGDDAITSITSDRQGNTWFGTFTAGLVFFYGDQFTALTVKDGLPDNNVRGIVQDDEGNMWMATLGGLAMYDGVDVRVWTEKDGLGSSDLGAITTDEKRIYAGSLNGYVNVVENGNVKSYAPPPGVKVGEIISMTYSRDGAVWIGTVSNGLFRFVNGKTETVNTGNTLLYNPIWAVHEADDGSVWLGTEKGVFKMEEGNAVRPAATGKIPPALPVYGIQSDSTYIYFATQRSGIWRYNRKAQKYQSLTKEREGLGSNFTKGLYWTDAHTMYVTTTLGMDRIIFTADSQQIRHFWYRDGIGTDNFFAGAMCISKEKHLWLGSGDGAIIYTASMERSRLTPPHVDIKDVLLFNSKTDWELYADSIQRNGLPFEPELSYLQNQLTFRLAGIQFGAGVNIRYEYKLEGLDNNWNLLQDANSVSYSNLPPGDYRFLVRAGNSNNSWSQPSAFDFTITPPFWATWWFFLTVLVALSSLSILLTFLYRRFRTEFVRRHSTFNNHQLNISRLILLLAGVLYPVCMFLCHAFTPDLNVQQPITIVLGALSVCLLALTFRGTMENYASAFSQSIYSLVVVHVLYLIHVNQLHPVSVVTLAVVLGAGGIVFSNIRTVAIFSAVLLVSTGLLMTAAEDDMRYNRWLLLLTVVISIVVIFVNAISRLNLFNRLAFADTTINSSRSLVIAADEEGKIIFVSRSIRTLLGYTEEEVMGDGWWKLRSDDQESNQQMKNQVLEKAGTTPLYVAGIKAKNGSVRWIQWSDTELEGGIKVGIGLDITDRREIEERYRHIVEAATDLIYTADQRGNFTYVNDVVAKLTGYSAEELLGKHFTEVVQPDWAEEVRSFYLKQFSRRTVSTYFEFPALRKNGELIWIGQTVRILFDERRPTIIRGFQAIARDITENKRYEEELEKLSLVASETINGVLICDPSGKIEWVNEGFIRITGYVLNEVKGRLPGDVLAGDRTDLSAISEVRSQSRMAEGFHREFLVYHKNSSEIWLDVSNTPIVDENGKILKQIEIFTDITEKKRYEIQLNRYSTRLETLNLAKQELLRSQSVEAIAENVLGILTDRLPYVRRASIALFNEHTGLADFFYVLSDDGRRLGKQVFALETFRSLSSLRNNVHFHVRDLGKEEELSESDRENLEAGIRSYLVTPLFSQGQLIGSVNVGAKTVDAISEDDVEMVREVADAMAGTLLQLRYRAIIEQKNEDISASILYARRIQDAILPPEEMLREQVGDLFVLYKPKDMLSGDFYWAEKRGKFTFVAVVDSTGHGVPGALLSLMGQNLLNQAVHERHLVRPAAILDYLNAGIQHTLNQYKNAGELRDGMDIALCVFEAGSDRMQFSGAINPMYVIRDGMLIQSKGNRFSIGSYFDNRMRPFTNQETTLQKGDVVYMFTDGYPDQLGGESDRKFTNRRFRELLLTIHEHEMITQKKILGDQINGWIGNNVQTDDICVIGIRI